MLPSLSTEKQCIVLDVPFDHDEAQPDLLTVKLYNKRLFSENTSTRIITMTSANNTEQAFTLIKGILSE